MEFVKLEKGNTEKIKEMSEMASSIVREHYDPLLGEAQNTYMIEMFQSEKAIAEQLEHGYRYYFVRNEDRNVGFIAFYPRENAMYLSKFYLYKTERKKGYSRKMLEFVISEAKKEKLDGVELNVNKENSTCRIYDHLGLHIIRAEKNDIGSGYYMDDYVYRIDI